MKDELYIGYDVNFPSWWETKKPFTTKYIRADVAQAQLDAERKRIVDAIDAILTPFTPHGISLRSVSMAIKRCVWSDDEDPREVLRKEVGDE